MDCTTKIERISRKTLTLMQIASFVGIIALSFAVIMLLEASGYAGSLEDTQLGFDGAIIRIYFAQMTPDQTRVFIFANILDYGFMCAYACFFFSSNIKISREISVWPKLHKFSVIMPWIGILSGCFDACENFFLLLMASNPTSFPLQLAIFHSLFATLKFALLYFCFGWIVVLTAVIFVYKVFFRNRPPSLV